MTSSNSSGVAIIGGGLCGLSLAIALQKRSIPYTIYEARASFTEYGAGINLGPNTLEALQLIDESLGEAVKGICTRNPPGKEDVWIEVRLGAPTHRFPDAQSVLDIMAPPTGNSTVRRNDLLNLLADTLGPEHSVFNKKLAALEQSDSGVKITFADGTEDTAAVVIACDGIHSAARRAMLGSDNPAASPQYSEHGVYRAVVPMKALEESIGAEMARTSQIFMGPGGYTINYPVESGQSVNVGFWQYRKGSWPHREWVLPNQGHDMEKRFAGWGDTVHRIMKLMGDPAFMAAHHHASRPNTFFKGRICLIGDAAHSMPPHQGAGAGQAMEDAYVMAEVLQDLDWQQVTEKEVVECLSGYEAVRKPRFQRALQTSVDALSLWNDFYSQSLTEEDLEGFRQKTKERFRWLHYSKIAEQAESAREKFVDMSSGCRVRIDPSGCRSNSAWRRETWNATLTTSQSTPAQRLQTTADLDFSSFATTLSHCIAYVAIVLPHAPGPDPVYLGRSYGDSTAQRISDNSDHQHNNNNTQQIPLSLTHCDHTTLGYPERPEEGHKKRRKHSGCITNRLRRFMAAVQHQPRPHLRRHSPLSAYHHTNVNTFSTNAPMMKRIDVSDSDSDDEPPPAIKFSKVTEALLNDNPLPTSPPRQDLSEPQRFVRSTSAPKGGLDTRGGLDTPSRAPGIKILRKSSPSALASQGPDRGHTPPRVVQVGSGPMGSGRRTISISGPYPQRFAVKREPTPQADAKPEMVTPVPATRTTRPTRSRAGSNASQDGQNRGAPSTSRPGSSTGFRNTSEPVESRLMATSLSNASLSNAPDTVSRYGSSTLNRSRNISAESVPPPGSTRIKRAPIGTGTFLKSGPVRRGFRRRDSEDNVSPADEYQSGNGSHHSTANYTPRDGSTRPEGTRSRSGSVNARAASVEPISTHDFAQERPQGPDSRPSSRQASHHFSRSQMSNDSRPPSRQTSREPPRTRQPSVERFQHLRQPSVQPEPQQRRPSVDQGQQRPVMEQRPPQRAPSMNRLQYRYAAPKAHIDASEDQENMPPPTFRRNKDQEFKYLGKASISIMSDDEKPIKSRQIEETPVPVPPQQQERRALGAISGNTPHRPAPPPPPKMSVLETATATAGASTTKSRKKRSHIVINGKIFTQMGKIGKGGSSDVYCVMAENYKTFALKRVKLDDCDESAVRGYKGEIDLLKKLTEVERVVRLFDWELNDEKQELLVLMEKGDTDLNRILTLRLNGVDAKFDSAFARYHWKEMLECVQAVHEHDIVHSDLKPANFLLVQGRLKLIDFGIANAIDIDNTCNVHRDSHVGTPNYMSPESITDTNAAPPGSTNGRDADGRPLKKDMRIGKSSDVWSLGCILYQMTYGRPPFAHIGNQISRIMAITNPRHTIDFPDTGVGGSVISPALKGTLRRCLQRDPDLRPTIKQLLSDNDGFMNPDAAGAVMMTEDLLAQIINKVVDRCRDPKRGVPTPDEVRVYPGSFMAKIREMVEKG